MLDYQNKTHHLGVFFGVSLSARARLTGIELDKWDNMDCVNYDGITIKHRAADNYHIMKKHRHIMNFIFFLTLLSCQENHDGNKSRISGLAGADHTSDINKPKLQLPTIIEGDFRIDTVKTIKFKDEKNSESVELDSLKREELKITVINDSSQTKYLADSFVSFWIPTQNQLDTIDSIIEQAICINGKDYYKHLKPNSVKHYYRQYICYTDAKGDSIAFINAFLKIDFLPLPGDVRKQDDWQFNLIKVFDGGDRYWQVWINFSEKRYYNFNVNGEA